MKSLQCPKCKDKSGGCNCDYQTTEIKKSYYTEKTQPSNDLEIGRQILNWIGNAALKGYIDYEDKSYSEHKNEIIKELGTRGKVNVYLHTHGIMINDAYYTFYPIHYTQVNSLSTELGKLFINFQEAGSCINKSLPILVTGHNADAFIGRFITEQKINDKTNRIAKTTTHPFAIIMAILLVTLIIIIILGPILGILKPFL